MHWLAQVRKAFDILFAKNAEGHLRYFWDSSILIVNYFVQQVRRSRAGVRDWECADSNVKLSQRRRFSNLLVKLVNSGVSHGVVNSFSAGLCVSQSAQFG